MTFGSTGVGNDQMGATPANMEVYVCVAESAASGEFDVELDSSAESSSLPRSGRYDSLSSSLKHHKLQEQQQQKGQEQQQEELKSTGSGLVAGSNTGFAPISEVGQQQQHEQESRKASGEGRAQARPPSRARGVPVPLKRRQGMSDVWQQQGAFRSNRKSMKSMFEEVREKREEKNG